MTDDIFDILYLFNQSPFHLSYSLSDFNSYAILPYLAGNYTLTRNEDRPVGFSSWVLLTQNEGNLMLMDKFSWPHSIHQRTKTDKLDIWGIEFIAPFGNAKQLKIESCNNIRDQFGPTSGYFRRFKNPLEKKKWIVT